MKQPFEMNKFVIGLIVAFAIAACNGYSLMNVKVFEEDMKKCLDRFDIEDDMEIFMKKHMEEPTEDSWRVMACAAKMDGSLSEDNKYDIAKIKENMKEIKEKQCKIYDKLMPAISMCAEKTNADDKNADDEIKAVEVFSTCLEEAGVLKA